MRNERICEIFSQLRCILVSVNEFNKKTSRMNRTYISASLLDLYSLFVCVVYAPIGSARLDISMECSGLPSHVPVVA